MQVIAHEPRFWFLVEGADGLFLDVNCNFSAIGFGRLIRLDQQEERQFRERGRSYIDELAQWVDEHAFELLPRHEQGNWSSQVSAAITAWCDVRRDNGTLPRS